MRSADELAVFEGVRLGSERAFRRLVAAHDAPMLRLAGLYAHDAAGRAELVRWTWSTALHGLGMFTWHTSFRAWLFGILAAHGRARPAPPTAPAPPAAPPSVTVPPAAGPPVTAVGDVGWAGLAWSPRWSPDGWRAVERALATLPVAQREVVHLRDVEGWPAAEADAALGVTADEGGRLLAQGRDSLRAAVRAWLGLPPPGPADVQRETDGVVELLGLLAPAAPAAPDASTGPASDHLVGLFRDWRASRRIPVWRRLRGAYLAR